MKYLLLITALLIATPTQAITIYHVAPEGKVLVGYEVTKSRYWGWKSGGFFGKKSKYTYTPIFAAQLVPEPTTYALLLVGIGLIAWKVPKLRTKQDEQGMPQ